MKIQKTNCITIRKIIIIIIIIAKKHTFDMKSIPIVALYWESKESYMNLDKRDVFPTVQIKNNQIAFVSDLM